MTQISKYEPGQFSWIDLMSPDASASKAFYQALFGWTTVDNDNGQDGIYTQFHCNPDGDAARNNSENVVAGLGEMNDAMKQSGMPAVWNNYVSVQDADATVARAVELGGAVMMPVTQILDAGRMAILTDPTGAQLSIWEAGAHIGSGQVNTPVSLCWNELNTRDPETASTFYSGLFGWAITDSQDGSGYLMIENAGRMNGGIRPMDAAMDDVPAHWMAYVSVADCDATVARAVELGASTHVEPMDIPPGRFAVIADPQGAVLTVMKVNEPD